jgi:23S rRNA (uracil1939-C5)-methyltransferase
VARGARRRKRGPPERPKIALELDGVSHLGGAVGRADEADGDGRGRVYFVSYGLPGERVLAEVVEPRGSFSRAHALEVLERPHRDRAAPPCPYFGSCGGCSWQHARYERQLMLKTETVREQLARLGGFDAPPLRPMIGAAAPYHYRNHARFSTRRDGTLGFTREHTHAVMTIEHCHLMMPRINELLAALQGRATGRLHQVAVRHSMRTGQSLVSPAIPDAPFETGQTHLEEEVLGRRFRIAANSFFQVNTRPVRRVLPDAIGAAYPLAGGVREGEWSQADLLALLALDRLCPTPGDTVVDAYSGVGTFALLVAERVGRVVAVEEAASAVSDARRNAAGLSNVDFVQGRVEEVLPRLDVAPDGAILDPARAGCARPVLDALIARRVRRIVYVSCDPSTLARDLRILVDAGYGLVEVQPVDMFPQTAHIECVATLER